MNLKTKTKMFFALLVLSLLSAFCVTAPALAAPTLNVGAISGDNVVGTPTHNTTTDTWTATIAHYPILSATDTSFSLGSISGTTFTAGSMATYVLHDSATSALPAGWSLNPSTHSVGTGTSFSGASTTLTGQPPASSPVTWTFAVMEGAGPATSNPVTLDLTFVTKNPAPVFSLPAPSFSLGQVVSQDVRITGLKAGGTIVSNFTLSSLTVDGVAAATNWNGLTITPNFATKTISFSGTATALTTTPKTFTVRMAAGQQGAVDDAQLTVTVGAAQSLTLTPSTMTIDLDDTAVSASVDVTVSPSNVALSALSVTPAAWNGLTLTADPATQTITIGGNPTSEDVGSFNVAATTVSGDLLSGSFQITVKDMSDPNRLNANSIGIWNYGNKAMLASELIYYKGFSANTGYNPRGKYDLLFFSDMVMDGDKIRVLVREPNSSSFSEVPWLITANIPLEAWHYVNKNTPTDPHASGPTTKGSGTSLGWYRADINSSIGAMTIAVNSQPNASGYYTFRIEYAYTNANGVTKGNYQDFTLNCTSTSGGGGGGGCDAGLGAAVLGIFAAGASAFAISKKRKK